MIYISKCNHKYDIDLSSWDGLLFTAKSFDPIFLNITLHLSLQYIREEIPQFVKDYPEYFI